MSTLDSDLPIPAGEPDGEDIELELDALAMRRRRKLPRLTLALAVAVVGAGAFIGGAEAQRHFLSEASLPCDSAGRRADGPFHGSS